MVAQIVLLRVDNLLGSPIASHRNNRHRYSGFILLNSSSQAPSSFLLQIPSFFLLKNIFFLQIPSSFLLRSIIYLTDSFLFLLILVITRFISVFFSRVYVIRLLSSFLQRVKINCLDFSLVIKLIRCLPSQVDRSCL